MSKSQDVVGLSTNKPSNEPRGRTAFPSTLLEDHALAIFIALRLLNALTLQTFFQPDEYYQLLEPAWWLAFGDGSGAWITWEWKHHLRSALHPTLFASTYRVVDLISSTLGLAPPSRAALLLVAPRILQASIAALGDYYTYKLARHIYGKSSYETTCAAWLTAGSAWNWFVSTRTFSNGIETTLTVIALYNWPYHWALGTDEVGFQVDDKILRIRQSNATTSTKEEGVNDTDETTRLRMSVLCAALAVILRPTNAIIWLTLTVATFGRGMYQHGMHWEIGAFIREGLLCSSTVLTLSVLVDRLFYRTYTFPMWHFLKFNVVQSIAVFYGNNNWHYYLSQGYPLLLTVAMIPAIPSLYTALFKRHEPSNVSIQSRLILHRLAVISIVLPAVLSILSHKEVRFIYPILPALHILAAHPLARILSLPDHVGNASLPNKTSTRNVFVPFLILLNIAIAAFFSYSHNAGLITVTSYIRSEFEHRYHSPHMSTSSNDVPNTNTPNLTFAVLMPCHSLPWRSHLQHPPTLTHSGISGWALTCEPPLDLSPDEKAGYKDEADVFYADHSVWIKQNMARDFPKAPPSPGVYAADPAARKKLWSNPDKSGRKGVWMQQGEGGVTTAKDKELAMRKEKRAWPDYLVFFAQLEQAMSVVLRGSAYVECARFRNSLFHDDWRRVGDVVVWCLPDRPDARLQGTRDARISEVRNEHGAEA